MTNWRRRLAQGMGGVLILVGLWQVPSVAQTVVIPWFVTPNGQTMVNDTADALTVVLEDADGAQIDFGAFHAGTCADPVSVSDDDNPAQSIAANTNRLSFSIHNDSTATLWIAVGSTATSTSYMKELPPDAQWEMEYPIKTEAISLIWSADASGAARYTECAE